ncbi:L-rhamnose mutarotase [Pinibacter aurantiacus]|uniref:L-rhamnose mutarotase n=1 Tax=Pinibacter aurantiacus TaxID=2851599 RepID=A0A9E2S7V6_9BACT|nr:L-rhamnose mutarotase [Pinibacter aurantiacus]MBV4357506.1 L-rhamnose mutarotase [Pinibacter aurantiacus]
MKKIFQRSCCSNIYLKLVWVFMAGLISCQEHNAPAASSSNVISVKTIASTPAIVEVIDTAGKMLQPDSLIAIGKKNALPLPGVYQWKNHLVLYAAIDDLENVQKQTHAAYPNAEVKVYQHPFYNFNRKHCGDTTSAKEWDNIILTANLVRDTALQREYLDYHATQFEKWPEVSKGFCNASFQQLLVYKNDRQLMLVISIPKGASLDELNPKTTENNPRVDEWNQRMKKYQEGITGTGPGETWVFLKQLRIKN